jgi:chemotaxis protein MotB
MHHWIGLSLLSLSLVGCVSQDKYNALKISNDDLTQRLSVAEQEAATASARADALASQGKMQGANSASEQAMIQNLQAQIASLSSENADLNKRYADALNAPPQTAAALPVQLSNALAAFASANPNLVDFDAARGTVKFRSDVTFAPGSAELTPAAKDIISKFATILNSSMASGYELMVAGHTDSTPVVNAATIRAGNRDNWFLSAHRAISVAEALRTEHVGSQRLGVAGYADQRPIASNSTEQGKAMNRRVEIMLLPTTSAARPMVTSGVAPSTPRNSTPAPKPMMNKDGSSVSSTDVAPAFPRNK